jgi:OmpA-OmpF porin, OOP family
MKSPHVAVLSLAAFALTLAAPSFAQQSPPRTSGEGLRMPYESGFWGHAGFSLGRARLRADCPGGFNCDLRDDTWKVFAGGKFNNTIGGEVGYLSLGDYSLAGGTTKARGVDLALTAGVPLGQNTSVFLKLGTIYTRTNTDGVGIATGRETGWGPRYGIGGQIGIGPQWAVRLDADRYRMDFAGGSRNVDTFTVGAQYSFR